MLRILFLSLASSCMLFRNFGFYQTARPTYKAPYILIQVMVYSGARDSGSLTKKRLALVNKNRSICSGATMLKTHRTCQTYKTPLFVSEIENKCVIFRYHGSLQWYFGFIAKTAYILHSKIWNI